MGRGDTRVVGGEQATLGVGLQSVADVIVPDDFAAALSADPTAGAFFAKLSNSQRRYHVDNIIAAKTAETRQRRIDKAISLFRQGKQRGDVVKLVKVS